MADLIYVIPTDATITVSVGAKLHIGTEIGQIVRKPVIAQTIPLAHILGFKPEKIFKHLKKMIGDNVHQGETLAIKDGVLTAKKYIAETDGVLANVNHHTGEIIIEQTSDTSNNQALLSLVEGHIQSVQPGQIVVAVHKTHEVAVRTIPKAPFGAEVLFTNSKQAMQLTVNDVKGKMVISTELSDYTVSKLQTLGASYCMVTETSVQQPTHGLMVLEKPEDMQTVIDFGPKAVYANATGNTIIFYR